MATFKPTTKQVDKLQEIYLRHFAEHLDEAQAYELGLSLIWIMASIYKPIPSDQLGGNDGIKPTTVEDL